MPHPTELDGNGIMAIIVLLIIHIGMMMDCQYVCEVKNVENKLFYYFYCHGNTIALSGIVDLFCVTLC